MIYTIGMLKMLGTQELHEDSAVELSVDDIVVIHSIEHRCIWQRRFQTAKYEFQGILPTSQQKADLLTFLENGGTIITSLDNASEPVVIPVLTEELTERFLYESFVKMEEEGDIANLVLPAYEWLPDTMACLPLDAMRKYKHSQCLIQETPMNDSTILSQNQTVGIMYEVGHGGRLIFTPLLTKELDRNNLDSLVNLVEKLSLERMNL